MENLNEIFDGLKEFYGTHKAAAEALEVSYVQYNAWRWSDEAAVPGRVKRYLHLSYKAVKR